MSSIQKAKELGREIRNSSEFLELKVKEENLSKDPAAQEIIQNVQEVQQELETAQRMGVQPNQEQMTKFNALREKMHGNQTLRDLVQAQEDLNEFMKEVNQAITDGIQEGEEKSNNQ
ncbi:YlbF family regulator [Candidatus Contubernalis alkaliaceticus]|uniref:YlbF family regulator n=1 Tax=Candidatus Contubernalis alkaliaceticus TaxID=338645 RepID=UPI001F4C364E|nr:YlbF family regulator [Candidatus Contubernalis alkalaceticus]UNC91963.1 YlbF family regulator [Candidatus Contubernalis alkalaceticus]